MPSPAARRMGNANTQNRAFGSRMNSRNRTKVNCTAGGLRAKIARSLLAASVERTSDALLGIMRRKWRPVKVDKHVFQCTRSGFASSSANRKPCSGVRVPILLAAGLGIAFRNRPAEVLKIAAVTPELAQSLRQEKLLEVQQLDADAAKESLRTGKVALLAEPGPTAQWSISMTIRIPKAAPPRCLRIELYKGRPGVSTRFQQVTADARAWVTLH